MPEHHHFTNYGSLKEALIAFGQLARDNGLKVGVQETLDALIAAREGVIIDLRAMKFALKALYCCSEEDSDVFDDLFDWFWNKPRNSVKSHITMKNRSNLVKRSAASVVMLGTGKQKNGQEEESKNTSGANAVERLRKTDFASLSEIDSQWLEEIAMKLWKQMSLRLKRKLRSSPGRGQLDLRRTIRQCIAHGGDPIDLFIKTRKPKRQRLIVLLDVSGSMDKYSFFLLRFLCALSAHFERIEAFLFSTHLVRISPWLNARNLDATFRELSARADNWSSGTRIGECFRSFNEEYAKRILNGHSTVIILSDGLDTGSPDLLASELKRIKLRTRQLLWLNPLKGMSGYQPVQQGMSAALPQVDVFESAHNLDSILELENFLLNV